MYIYPLQCIPNVVFLDSPRSFLLFLLPNQSFSHVSFFIFQAADQLALCLDSYRQRSWQATVIPQNKYPRDAFFFLNVFMTNKINDKQDGVRSESHKCDREAQGKRGSACSCFWGKKQLVIGLCLPQGGGVEGGQGNKTQVSRNKMKIKCRHGPQANFHVLIVLRLMLCAGSRLVRLL